MFIMSTLTLASGHLAKYYFEFKKVVTSLLVVMVVGEAGWMLNTWKMKCVTVSWNSHHTAVSSY